MATLIPAAPPPEITLETYTQQGYQFSYPARSAFTMFEFEGVQVLTALARIDDRTLECSITLTPHDKSTAEQAAKRFYANASPMFDEIDNVPPFPITLAGQQGWRTRKRFVDGLSAPLTMDQAYLQTVQGLLTFKFTAAPQDYARDQWIFDALLDTFAFHE